MESGSEVINSCSTKRNLCLGFLSVFFIGIIGLVDWLTGYEISFSIVYLIPIFFLTRTKKTYSLNFIIFISILAASAWFFADFYSGHIYSHGLIPFWNAFVRLGFFMIISKLLFSTQKENDLLEEKNIKLEEINQEKNRYLGIAAHDFRNAVGVIQTCADYLLSQSSEEIACQENRELLDMIKRTSENMMILLSDLLDITKIESGTLSLKIQPFNYLDLVKSVLKMNQLVATKKKIVFSLENQDESIEINADPVYLEQVLNNLFNNAVKYSHADHPVKVRITQKENQILTEVIDHGVGISEDFLSNLFKPFQKGGAKPTHGETSTGLGLSIVKKIVEAHQGQVGVNSQLGQGSNFYFTLPLNS